MYVKIRIPNLHTSTFIEIKFGDFHYFYRTTNIGVIDDSYYFFNFKTFTLWKILTVVVFEFTKKVRTACGSLVLSSK